MKLIPLLLLFPLLTFSAENLEIIELDSGSCWVDEKSSKIVSFGENKSFTLDEYSLNSLISQIENKLETYKEKLPAKRNVYLYCNSFAARLVLKFGSEKGICAWATHDGEDLKLDFLGNFEGKSKGICEVAIPGELLIFGDVPSLVDPKWDNYIKSAGSRKLILTKDYFFKEDKVIEKLKEKFPRLKIERNYLLYRAGEYRELSAPEFRN
jgi:hypothetical protein